LNTKNDEMIETLFRKPFEPNPKKEDDNFMGPHLKERLLNTFKGDLYDPIFGNILEKEKILKDRMRNFTSKQDEAKFMLEVSQNLCEQSKKCMDIMSDAVGESFFLGILLIIDIFKFITGPMEAGLMYAFLAEFIFDCNYKPKEGEKTTKELCDEILSGLHNNATTVMDFMVSDVSEAIRKYPKVIQFLRKTVKDAKWNGEDEEFIIKPKKLINELENDPELMNVGGKEVADEIKLFLHAFGFRGPAEVGSFLFFFFFFSFCLIFFLIFEIIRCF